MRFEKIHNIINTFKKIILLVLKEYQYIKNFIVYDLMVIVLLIALLILPVLIYGFPKFQNASGCYIKC
jgi:hypothetical protein